FALLLGRTLVVLAGLRPLRLEQLAVRRVGDRIDLLLPLALTEHLAEDRGIRAKRDAVHAAGAVARDILRDIRRDVAEIAERRRASRNQRPSRGQIGRQVLLGIAFFIAADDPLIEVIDI